MRRSWERNKENSNSLEGKTQRKCEDIKNVTLKKISLTSTVKMIRYLEVNLNRKIKGENYKHF